MPQMAPALWLPIFIMISTLLFCTNSIFYFTMKTNNTVNAPFLLTPFYKPWPW
uniref:ATP synthase F0 subunit 8 n=1 Tax=Gammarus nipponensis TaxID=353628 RepID=UPI00286C3934|nr:ATP synthase F0 subunit 8 [Gammarus nipponensis]WLS55459.1 ATP synthase F0 subunit 8 [Gammarus nipponensis]